MQTQKGKQRKKIVCDKFSSTQSEEFVERENKIKAIYIYLEKEYKNRGKKVTYSDVVSNLFMPARNRVIYYVCARAYLHICSIYFFFFFRLLSLFFILSLYLLIHYRHNYRQQVKCTYIFFLFLF